MDDNAIAFQELCTIFCGIAMGVAARVITLKVDSRQSPSSPNGVFNNLLTGFIASCLGAVALPALLTKNYVAVTFLAMAVQHFRDIRKMERDSLLDLENTEFIKRGAAYIDGISKTYESRNYISLLTSIFTVTAITVTNVEDIFIMPAVGIIGGSITMYFCYRYTKGQNIGDICSVSEGKIEVRSSELYVDDIFVSNTLGSDASRELIQEQGVAFVLKAELPSERLTLENYGQRQAILFEAVRTFGVKRYHFTRRSFDDGRVIIAFVPIIADKDGIKKAILNTPVLESSRKSESARRLKGK